LPVDDAAEPFVAGVIVPPDDVPADHAGLFFMAGTRDKEMPVTAIPVAPLSAHSILVFVLATALLLGLALLLGQLAGRVGMPAVAGELCAGVVLGPSVFGHLAPALSGWLLPRTASQMHLIDAVGEIGLILLVGCTGISIDPGLLRRRTGAVATVGAGALLVPLACGVAIGFALPTTLTKGGDRFTFAAFVGVALCVSAIPVIAKMLLEMGLLHRAVGQLIMGAATIDDVIGWLLLSVVSALAANGLRAHDVLLSVAWPVVVVIFCLTLARPMVSGVLRLSVRSARSVRSAAGPGSSAAEPGSMVAVTVLMLLGFAALTQALGMEAIIGALFGGMVIGSSKWLDRERLVPLQTFTVTVLAPLFFATAGLRMDLTALRRPTVAGAALVVLAVAIVSKFAGAYVSSRGAGLDHWNAVAMGAGLNARGVMEVILAITGLRLGVLNTTMYTIIILVAIITSVMAPPVLRLAARHIEVTPEDDERELRMNRVRQLVPEVRS
jgi:Kef-type K+ transport system membrane component KefB